MPTHAAASASNGTSTTAAAGMGQAIGGTAGAMAQMESARAQQAGGAQAQAALTQPDRGQASGTYAGQRATVKPPPPYGGLTVSESAIAHALLMASLPGDKVTDWLFQTRHPDRKGMALPVPATASPEELPLLSEWKQLRGAVHNLEPAAAKALAGAATRSGSAAAGAGAAANAPKPDTNAAVDPQKVIQGANASAAEDPNAPVSNDPAQSGGIKPMSQFRWYDFGINLINFDQAKERIPALMAELGLTCVVKEDVSQENTKLDGNAGHWWFGADGEQTTGKHAAKLIYTQPPKSYAGQVNPWTYWMSMKAPGNRDRYYRHDGNQFSFAATQKEGYSEVPEHLQNMDLRNIPGSMSCFATVSSMLAQSGSTAVKADSAGFGTDAKDVDGSYAGTTVDRDTSERSLRYLDMETAKGKAVQVGVSYKLRDINDGVTDHWVVITGCKTPKQEYTFADPGNGSTGTFVWDAGKGALTAQLSTKTYTLTWLRPNADTAKVWGQIKALPSPWAPLPGPEAVE